MSARPPLEFDTGGAPIAAVADMRGLTIEFPQRHAPPRRVVDSLDFRVARGELLGIVGESGSGKTLATQSLLGLLPSTARCVWDSLHVAGASIVANDTAALAALRGRSIGAVFQDALSAFNPVRNIGWHLREAQRCGGARDEREIIERSAQALAAVGVPSPRDRLAAYPHELSGGLRQRCMIALALINSPQLVIADEPTTALDSTVKRTILELLRARSVNCGIIFVTHDLGIAAEYCDRILVMRAGRCVEEGGAQGIFATPRTTYAQTLVACVPSYDRPLLGLTGTPRHVPRPQGPVALAAADIGVSFRIAGRRARALSGVSIAARAGETVAIVGESGSGKSTLARVLAGQQASDTGSVSLGGVPRPNVSGATLRAWRRQVQMVFQDPYASLDPRWRVGATLVEALGPGEGAAPDPSRALANVGLPREFVSRFPGQLSGGQRQRVGLARALLAQPKVVLADEPVSALDVSVQAEIVALIAATQTQQQFALLFISHDVPLVYHIADRIAVMYLGRIVESGPTRAVIEAPAHPYTAALVAASAPARLRRGVVEPLPGESASLLAPPPGCVFHPRCSLAIERCRTEIPTLQAYNAPAHDSERGVACFRAGEIPAPLQLSTSGDS
jgi:peptide/nickel transport system ATP-binding protein